MTFRFIYWFLLLLPVPALGQAPDLEDQTREIANELRCVVCQNLSVADSPSEMAQQMRAIVREQLAAGKTPQEIKEYFVSKYGEWVLLAPPAKGFSLVVWVLPFVFLIGGTGFGIWLLRRWAIRQNNPQRQAAEVAGDGNQTSESVTPGLPSGQGVSDFSSLREQLLAGRGRLSAELEELEFDFECGKVSESDYTSIRRQIELKLAGTASRLDSLPPPAPEPSVGSNAADPSLKSRSGSAPGFRRWQLAAGGAFLVVFGVTVGVLLTNSLRPRTSEQDSLTGDFLTGTAAAETRALLNEGKTAFAKQEWPKAIDAFKKVLAADPNQPEAHAYLGFILGQAGHTDGALMAFDKALSISPNLPMALWGKGMILYQLKKDYAGAREHLEKLLALMPQGEERNEIARALAEIPAGSTGSQQPAVPTSAKPSRSAQLSGTITIDPKLKEKVDANAVLFIIARPAGASGGPPLAVKKVDRPAFPLAYSLGSENVMMQGTPFTGKVAITARLDRDGNPTTRVAGDLSGDYGKNPVEIGSTNVDIVLDQVTK